MRQRILSSEYFTSGAQLDPAHRRIELKGTMMMVVSEVMG